MTCYLSHLGIVNALGTSPEEVLDNLVSGRQSGIVPCDWVPDFPTYVAAVPGTLDPIPSKLQDQYQSRNNELAWAAVSQMIEHIQTLSDCFGSDRIAVIIGTSTSGIGEGEAALSAIEQHGDAPAEYRYQQQEIGIVAEFVAEACNLSGPAYTISTACSSSGHAFNSAKSMLDNNIADAVIVGGVDSLCKLTVNGFAALESVSPEKTNPFSVNRSGITIGEAAALFIATREPSERAIELLAVGSSSDAHHISAPEPEGSGAERAINDALTRAGVKANEIDYINLHGTGTRLNDAMESKVVNRMFGTHTPCSSSKGQVGHCLGAAAANELALCWLSLQSENVHKLIPPHLWDEAQDDKLALIQLASQGSQYNAGKQQTLLSSSFAFGGNNSAVVIRECNHDN